VCSRYIGETIRELSACEAIELFLLQNDSSVAHPGIGARFGSVKRSEGVWPAIEQMLFELYAAMEGRVLSRFLPEVRAHFDSCGMQQFRAYPTIQITPLFSPSHREVHYSQEDITAIETLDLDLIVLGTAPRRLKGEILHVAREGIISFCHSDNRWRRGGPDAFWEVYTRRPSTGFVIEVLSEEPGAGSVLLRGDFATRRSYMENLADLYNESNPYLAKVVIDYAESGELPTAEARYPFGGYHSKSPSSLQLASYIAKNTLLFLSLIVDRVLLRREKKWGVAYIQSNWREADLAKGTPIKNPPGHFLADPFIIEREGRRICFLEDYDYAIGRACIAAVEIIDGEHYEMLGPVIEEPYHMSYPYLFEYEGTLYMVPETNEANAIRLYECTNFPLEWVYSKDVMSGARAFDSMIFQQGSTWWLLSNMSAKGKEDGSSQLMAYSSDDPLAGSWQPHRKNPIIFDSTIARNGGILDRESRYPIRGRQKQGFNSYGDALTLARMTDLTPESYSEEEVGEILPHFFDGISRCHHIHSDGNYTVYDYLRIES